MYTVFHLPATFLFDFGHTDGKMHPYGMHEFAASGVEPQGKLAADIKIA